MFHVWFRCNYILEFPLITPQDQDLYLLAFFSVITDIYFNSKTSMDQLFNDTKK